jgi:hypothetical protein
VSTLLALFAAAAAAVAATPAAGYPLPLSLASVEVFDRSDGLTLPAYVHAGERYIVGTPGHEYTLRVRNLTGERILAVTSVDGVNVVSGETAAPDQSGYVIEPYGSVDIGGWRKSLARTAAFYFTDLRDSYAARTGRPGNVGVIGVAVFRERERPVVSQGLRDRIAAAEPKRSAEAPAAAPASPPLEGRYDAPPEQGSADARRESVGKTMQAPLGTGHGRSETSYATRVAFERASTAPAEVLTVRYDRREALAALGVLPREPYYARPAPQPFPGALQFVPDPR